MIYSIFDSIFIKKEVGKFAGLVGLQPGWNVAEIGAGDGKFSMALADLVGQEGDVYATEFEADKVEKLLRKSKKRKISNLHILPAAATTSNLPDIPFNLIVMRKVYHHFTNPKELNQSFFKALIPGGKMVVIDFEPKWFLRYSVPPGIPKNRGGHGIPKQVLVDEVLAAGFSLKETIQKWSSGGLYCVIFNKPILIA